LEIEDEFDVTDSEGNVHLSWTGSFRLELSGAAQQVCGNGDKVAARGACEAE
jgi:hypothetical protein